MNIASRRVVIAVLLGAIAALGGCGGLRRAAPVDPRPRATVRVENRSWFDMTIYVVRSTQRMRLGLVTGTSTRSFVIPASLVTGGTPLRFLADPIGSNRAPISEEITVWPGDEVGLVIPP